MSHSLRIVHYLNQFFGGIGGEDKALTPPQIKEGPVGPGIAFHKALMSKNVEGRILATVVCGDDYAALDPAKAAREVLALIAPYQPDCVLAGPAFNAGRYGVACGTVCDLVHEERGIPAVTGMYPENPGADMYRRNLYIVKTTDSARGMAEAVDRMVDLTYKLVTGQDPGLPSEGGYIPRGLQKRIMVNTIAAKRAVDMMLARLAGQPFETELTLPKFKSPKPPAAVKDMSRAKVGLVTDGGLVPRGNPDGIERQNATKYGRYILAGMNTFDPAQWEVAHAGYDNQPIMLDPNRLVPLDVLRDLEKEGVIGGVGEYFYSTCGCGANLQNCHNMGRAIAAELREQAIGAVILVGT
jgi:betaine reductase